MHRWRMPLLVSLFMPCLAWSDAEWSHEIRPSVRVNDHSFDRVTAQAEGCKVNFALYFTAPEAQYQDSRNPVRNFHRFKARVRLGDHQADSPTFANRKPGRRWLRFSHDSTPEGCWAKEKTKLWKLDVNGCRGEPCRVEPL